MIYKRIYNLKRKLEIINNKGSSNYILNISREGWNRLIPLIKLYQ